MKNAYEIFNINTKLESLAKETEKELEDIYKGIEEIALINQAKILKAFQDVKISEMHFGSTTGYGHADSGRDAIEELYANVFEAEDALVRIQFVSGTHTIATVLKGILMPKDKLLAISGKPYDTLCTVIGLEENKKSLINYGIEYDQIDLDESDNFKTTEIKEYLKNNKVKMIHIQRSKGYAVRKALLIEDIEQIVKEIREVDKDVVIFVDNCYGEYTEEREPTAVGVDICCGSLIKNAGGGICLMGGYVAGKHDLIELVAEELTCAGIGKENGATLNQNRNMIQGMFMAPTVVSNAVKTAVFTSKLMEKLGFDVYPKATDKRADIVQIIKFGDKEKLIKFIQGIQGASPVDSHVVPMPYPMAGYADDVIMAAGTFVEGATIELSADSPMREPYVAYIQGALTYESAKLAILNAVSKMLGE